MNRYNPYTVPEGFFENVCQDALKARARHRRNIRMAVGAVAVAVILLVTPFVLNMNSEDETEYVASSYQDQLVDNYENDLFLLVSFE